MNWTELDQGKYTIEQVFINQEASNEVRSLALDFHNELLIRMKKLNLKFYARTHIRGISYMYNEKKSFMPIDILKNQISVNFWTGNKDIEGLKKGTWLSGKSEFTGSERIAIRSRNDFDLVFKFALKAYEIAKEWYEVYMVKT